MAIIIIRIALVIG